MILKIDSTIVFQLISTPFSIQIMPNGIKNKYLTHNNLYNQFGQYITENSTSKPTLIIKKHTSA